MEVESLITFSRENEKLMQELKKFSSETYHHCFRVKKLTLTMIQYINRNIAPTFSQDEIDWICKGALMHDIGKLFVRNYVLTKKSSLTQEEREAINQHTVTGSEAVQKGLSEQESRIVMDICLYHHERAQEHLCEKDDALPLYVQIVAICDAYDALCNERHYHKAYTTEESIAKIEGGECGAFSRFMLDCLKETIKIGYV